MHTNLKNGNVLVELLYLKYVIFHRVKQWVLKREELEESVGWFHNSSPVTARLHGGAGKDEDDLMGTKKGQRRKTARRAYRETRSIGSEPLFIRRMRQSYSSSSRKGTAETWGLKGIWMKYFWRTKRGI